MKKSIVSIRFSRAIGLLFFLLAFAGGLLGQATLSVQGVLKKSDGTAVNDESYSVTYTLWKSQSGTSPSDRAWEGMIPTETKGGVYSVVLGGPNSPALTAPFDTIYYLGVKVQGSSQELQPRPLLTHAPYAMSLLGQTNRFPSNGNVGVGTTKPKAKLEISSPAQNRGLLKLSATTGAIGDRWWMGFTHDSVGGTDANDRARVGVRIKGGGAGELFFTAGKAGSQKEGMRITALGNVEVGDTMKLLNNPNQTEKPKFNVRATESTADKAVFNIQNDTGDDIMTVRNDRSVVIHGVDDGDNFPLQIEGYANFYLFTPFPFATRGFASQPGTSLDNYSNDTKKFSLRCESGVVAALFSSYSDKRIKNIVGCSKPAEDLKILQKISITDYTFKDWISNGNNVTKKVIAQEVEEVYPQAVSKSVGVVPDIYQHAQIKAGRVEVPNNLQAGERVQLIFGSRREIVEVLSADATGFTTPIKAESSVFVYGREVKDFRSVDYDALSMLNISATQELARRLELLENENAALKTENATLSAGQNASAQMLNGFEERIKALEARAVLGGSK